MRKRYGCNPAAKLGKSRISPCGTLTNLLTWPGNVARNRVQGIKEY